MTARETIPAQEAVPRDARTDRVRVSPGGWLARFGVPIAIVVLIAVFWALNPNTFVTGPNITTVIASNSIALLLALGALTPLIAGEFDLSIGFVLELSAVVVAVLIGQLGLPVPLALPIVLVMGVLIGLFNGFLVTKVGMSSFIATLGVGSLVGAASLYLTGGALLMSGIPRGLIDFGQGNIIGIPNVFIIAMIGLVVFWIVCEHLSWGRRLLAVGLSRNASQLAGIKTDWMRLSTFMISGGVAALCGFLLLSRIGSASSGIGTNFLLPALAACFLGATTVKVGRFNVIGTAFAVVLVAVGLNGLQLLGVPGWVTPAFNGAALLIAVGASRLAANARR